MINEVAVDSPGHISDFEESIVLLRAESDAAAEAYARAAETSYLNQYGETVRWSFVELAALNNLAVTDPAGARCLDTAQVGSGVEITSRFFGDLQAYREAWSPDR